MKLLTRWILFAVAIASEAAAVWLCYFTEGEMAVALLGMLLLANIVLVPFAWAKPKAGLPLVGALWLLIVPYIAWQGVQLARAQVEADRIVAYVNEAQSRDKRVPVTLDAYRFRDEGIRKGIFSYHAYGESSFRLAYGPPGHEDVAHWYDTGTGWGYHPD